MNDPVHAELNPYTDEVTVVDSNGTQIVTSVKKWADFLDGVAKGEFNIPPED